MSQLIQHGPDAALLLGPEGEVAAGSFLAQVGVLAEALPATRYVVNLCETRHGFMLGFAAALVRGRTSLLPPGQGRGDLDLVLRQYADACILVDAKSNPQISSGLHVVDVTAFLTLKHDDEMRDRASASVIDADLQAAILFTSGSTGQPAAHAKTWGQLCSGADALAEALGWHEAKPSAKPGALVGSVPSQHMFGLETTVMLPWRHGIAVHHHKPLLPADLEQALLDCARPAWWMTTPVHLRAPLKQPAALPHLQGVVASTMSLPPALATAAESAWQVPVMEIYGATETGALALRRTAREELWTALPGVSLRRQGEGGGEGNASAIWVEGAHIGAPVRLADELELGTDGRFRWLGRATDVVKVGGKRASLSALNQHLTELPGIEDGAYFLPADDTAAPSDVHASGAHRLAAFYVSATTEPRRVLELLRERVDPVFLPRPLYRVEQLPRNANGKLVQAALTELLAQCRVRSAQGNAAEVRTTASFIVPGDHPALAGHFPGNPIVPGAVILARAAQGLSGLFPDIRFVTLLGARFHAPLKPDVECLIAPRLEGGVVRFEVRMTACDTLIASGQWACAQAQTLP